MFVNVGRFHFRPMNQDERESIMRRIGEDIPPIARTSAGFRAVYFARPSDHEVMAVWLWESEADWDAALPRFGPALQEYVVPNLAGAPERVGADVLVEVTG